MPDAKRPPLRFLTGVTNPTIEAWALGRDDVGLVISPLIPQYLPRLRNYRHVMVDNGAFSKATPFSPEKFLELLERLGADEDLRSRVDFVVAPDVPGDAEATMKLFETWGPKIRALGFPVALAFQDGIEGFAESEIPWNSFDWVFIGGTDSFKLGDWRGEVTGNSGFPLLYEGLFGFAWKHEKPIHVGRVNSAARMVQAAELGATSCDGTFLGFGPKANVPRLEKMLSEAALFADLVIPWSEFALYQREAPAMPETVAA